MGAHDNVHIPSESWPNWTWYALEFAVVLAVSMVVAWRVSDAMLPAVAAAAGHADALASWDGISIHSAEFRALSADVEARIVAMSNWAFYAVVGVVFLAWYVLIRGFALKKRVLG